MASTGTTRVLGIIGGALTLLVGGLVLTWVIINPSRHVRAQLNQHLPTVEKVLGRKLVVAEVATMGFPQLGVLLRGVELQDDERVPPKERRSPLRIRELGLRLSLWDLLVSLGGRFTITAFYADGLSVNLVRRADGSLATADITEHVERWIHDGAPAPAEKDDGKDRPLNPRVRQVLMASHVEFGGITNGSFVVEDQAAGTTSRIDQVNLTVHNIGLDRVMRVHASAAAFSDARNAEVNLSLGPIPADGGVPMTLRLLRGSAVKLESFSIAQSAGAAGWVVPEGMRDARLLVDWRIDDAGEGAPVILAGSTKITGLSLPDGDAVDAGAEHQLRLDWEKDALEIERGDITLGAASIALGGSLQGIKAITWEAQVKDGRFHARLDASNAFIVIPGKIHKPMGTPLFIDAQGTVRAGAYDADALTLQVASVKLQGSGALKGLGTPQPRAELGLASEAAAIADLRGVFPIINVYVPKDVDVDGDASFSVKGSVTPGKIDLSGAVRLHGVRAARGERRLQGDVSCTAALHAAPGHALQLDAGVNLDEAFLAWDGWLDKRPGVAAHASLGIQWRREQTEVTTLRAQLGRAQLRGSGTVAKDGAAAVKGKLASLELDRLADVIPPLRSNPVKKIRLQSGLEWRGNPRTPESCTLGLHDLTVSAGKNGVEGSVTIKNLRSPVYEVDLHAPRLHTDELFPDDRKATSRTVDTERRPHCHPVPSWLKTISVEGRLRMRQARIWDFPMERVDARIALEQGDLRVKTFRFDAYGGVFSGSRTSVGVAECVQDYRVELGLENVDVNALLSAHSQLRNVLYGRFTGKLHADGKGVGLYYMARARAPGRPMDGTLSGVLKNGRYSAAHLAEEAAGPVAGLLPVGKVLGRTDGSFKTMRGNFTIRDGRYHLQEPIVVEEELGRTELRGSIGMDTSMDLKGTSYLDQDAVRRLTRNACRVKDEVPVNIQVRGVIKKPRVNVLDSAKAAQTVKRGCLRSDVVEGAREAMEEKAGGVGKRARDLKDSAAEKARDVLGDLF